MSEGYMPTTKQVEDDYAHDPVDEYRDPVGYEARVNKNRRAFHRWLRDVKAQAWAEGHSAGLWASPDSAKDNPYREGSE